MTADGLRKVMGYHQRTKHQFGRFARGPRTLDWATQPEPFRRYVGADLLPLEVMPLEESIPYDQVFSPGWLAPAPLSRHSVSQLLYDSLSISAWKRAGDVAWALRVNPSSGNLHPTECYVISGEIPGLTATPTVCHYAVQEHALEVRARIPAATWQTLAADLPADTLLLGLTSIHWREAWKYGERAFRYCQLDVGHAMGAISLAAAGLGWEAMLLDGMGTEDLARLLGVEDPRGAEKEHPDCLLAIHPQGTVLSVDTLPVSTVAAFAGLPWIGRPNLLSPRHVDWPIIDEVEEATSQPVTRAGVYGSTSKTPGPSGTADDQADVRRSRSVSLRQITRQRRSAVAMDRRGTLPLEPFYGMLSRTVARPRNVLVRTLAWSSTVHLILFVHRVEGLAPGLYVLVREPEDAVKLQSVMRKAFTWKRPSSCPPGLDLYELARGDFQMVARQLSCQQAIASDGCFSVGMLAAFEGPLRRFGPRFYRRLLWECGVIGQVLYLEAEAAGVRGTGIGCFFDDGVHGLLGIDTDRYQSLYHFTVGHPLRDRRLAGQQG